ncbi:MAG: hypothetical protein JNK87_24940 [Bryobacterales bacterium]|nr:hypothetical protein [Bryobacterales bacterium]
MQSALTLITASLLLGGGCASMRSTSTAQGTSTTAPSGPIRAETTTPNLIPAGTTIAVRANEAISSTDGAGARTYQAEIAQDIVDQNGNILVRRGSPAELAVTQADEGGRVSTPNMELVLRSVTMDGRRQVVETAGTEMRGNAGLGANRRTATMVGGGAVLGTLLGAVVGGGAGAAAGAVVGAAGGATAQVLTRGTEVRVPAETILTFRLDEPLRLT